MKTKLIIPATVMFFFILPFTLFGQVKVTWNYIENQDELKDFFRFEGIQYQNLSFTSKELANKAYQLSVKEIWDGEITNDSIIFSSKAIPIEWMQTVGDTILNLRIVSKLTNENKLKMDFNFLGFSTHRSFDAAHSKHLYSLRPAFGLNMERTEFFEFDEKFYLLVYMLPYEVGTSAQYCTVANSGKDIENWGKEFGIKHYLVFEMIFESI